MCTQYGERIGPLMAEIGSGIWGTPANFNEFRVLASLLHQRRATEINQTARCLAVSWAGTLYIHFGGSCPLTELCHVQSSLCVKVLPSTILAALGLLHGTRAVGVGQTLWHGTRNGITELSQMAPPIFGWAAITLGIGPHSTPCYSLDIHNSITIIFGRRVTEKVRNQKMPRFPTSPL